MDVNEIRKRGQFMGIPGVNEMSQGDIIRAIQRAEGSRDCYGNFWRFDCLEFDCCWREDCLSMQPG